jgi:hypothetical protein
MMRTFTRSLTVVLAAAGLVSQACAAVVILEGSAPPPSAQPPAPPSEAPALAPAPALPPAEPARPALVPPPDSLTPPAPLAPVATAPPVPAVPPAPPVAATPSPPASSPSLASTELPSNPAELSVEMLPGATVSVGSVVSFKISSKKAGYLVLIDVDANGHLSQIYPYTASLMRTNRANGNYIKAGGTLTIPLANDPYAGVRYVVSPPNGRAMVLGILSASPVQLLDLPDVPPEMIDRPGEILAYLSKRTGELRIPDGNQLKEAKWSFNAKAYLIQ